MATTRLVQEEEILDRLAAHGINPSSYINIKSIVSFAFPQARVLFVKQFDGRTIEQVLKQIDRWRKSFQQDFIFSAGEKSAAEKIISRAELLAWQALLDVNSPKVGPWTWSKVPLPEKYPDGQPMYIRPALEVGCPW
jgi:hypothetical protein